MRYCRFHACLVILAPFVLASVAGAQQADRITYYNRAKNKEETVARKITAESPKEITFTTGGRDEKIRAADVLDVDYQSPAEVRIDYFAKARRDEADADKSTEPATRVEKLDEAVALYRKAVPKLESHKFAQRHIEFQIAKLLARQAEDDATRLDAALSELQQFKTQHGNGWQIAAAGKLLARLQIAKGDIKGALATYEEFARREDLAPDVRQEFEMLGVRSLIHAGDYPTAERKLDTLARSLPKNDPRKPRVEVYLAACKASTNLGDAEKRLRTVINGDTDNEVKALAYNTLGDCYRVNGKLDDAFWQYLWVDIVYNQDRQEHAKALYYLSSLFEKAKKNPARAQACRERLLNDRLFAGLEFQKMAARDGQRQK
jgi:tetratricopeptide (TPR) repeat protein